MSDTDTGSSHCAVCGTEVSTEEWHPAAMEEGSDGSVRLRTFCTDECRDQWEADSRVAATE